MIKKRLLLTGVFLGILLVSLSMSSFTFKISSPAGSAQVSSSLRLDCFRRELHLKSTAAAQEDASNFYVSLS